MDELPGILDLILSDENIHVEGWRQELAEGELD